jgi:hypothetical protein
VISQAGGHGLSRFSRTEVPYMPWFCDHAGSAGGSRPTPPAVLPSANEPAWAPRIAISRLHSPACTYPCQRFATPSRVVDAGADPEAIPAGSRKGGGGPQSPE